LLLSFQYKVGFCPVCGKKAKLAYSNNILAQPICFDCIKQHLHYDSTHDANIFCRTYNIPFDPSLWIKMATAIKGDVFEQYMAAQLETHNEFKSGNDDI
jgi:NMD protein affecting ribosome stability and mRNA decay